MRSNIHFQFHPRSVASSSKSLHFGAETKIPTTKAWRLKKSQSACCIQVSSFLAEPVFISFLRNNIIIAVFDICTKSSRHAKVISITPYFRDTVLPNRTDMHDRSNSYHKHLTSRKFFISAMAAW